jgi:hypothetical protein
VKKLLLIAGAASFMAACSDAATGPSPRMVAPGRANTDFVCRSGYVVAYDEYGNPYCAPDGGSSMTSPTTASPKPARP